MLKREVEDDKNGDTESLDILSNIYPNDINVPQKMSRSFERKTASTAYANAYSEFYTKPFSGQSRAQFR